MPVQAGCGGVGLKQLPLGRLRREGHWELEARLGCVVAPRMD